MILEVSVATGLNVDLASRSPFEKLVDVFNFLFYSSQTPLRGPRSLLGDMLNAWLP